MPWWDCIDAKVKHHQRPMMRLLNGLLIQRHHRIKEVFPLLLHCYHSHLLQHSGAPTRTLTMKKSLSNPLLNISSTTIASTSSAGSSLRSELDKFSGRKVIPQIPFSSEMVKIGDIDCCLHTYDPVATFSGTPPPKALVVFLHGFNAHGAFPTTKIVADLMLRNGFAFMAPDLPGHGRSSGSRGFLESGELMIDFSSRIIEHAYRAYLEEVSLKKTKEASEESPGLKLFVVGSSMGGNLALQSALRSKDICGVILMAPMLRIALISPVTRFFVNFWARALPQAEVIPIRKNCNYRCPQVHDEAEKDELKPHQEGKDFARIQSVASLVELADSLDAQFDKVSCPCLVMVGDEDTTVDNQGAVDLVRRARSKDMSLKRYPALHGLMGEPSPVLNRIQEDMIAWLDVRYDNAFEIRSSL